MEFKSIITAHDLNLWQFIHPKPNSYWQHQSPILIGNIKVQFSLALFYQKKKKKKAKDYQRLAKKKYYGKMLPWQKRTMAIIL